MTMKTTDTFLAEIVDTGMDGEGVAKIENIPVFVPYAAVGELCKIKIEKLNKNYARAKLVKVVRPSADRVSPPCVAYGECGGCCLQHISFDAENKYKRDYLKNMLHKARIDFDVAETVYGKPYEYRNKLQMPFAEKDGKVVLGFYKRGTHGVVELNNCALHGVWAEKLIDIVTSWANGGVGTPAKTAYNEVTGKGYLRHLVARYEDGFLSITIVVCGKTLYDKDALFLMLKKSFDCALYVSVNTKRGNVILGEAATLVAGTERELNIDGLKLKLSPMSFLQVNDEVRAKLYASVAKAAEGSDVIFDVYSGAGILTATLATGNPNATVYGIEIIPDAVKNADGLMINNGCSDRVKNICGDAAELLPDMVQNVLKCDNIAHKTVVTVVIDPPRKGCDEKVLRAIVSSEAGRVIYVSCNPATLARDLKLLTEYYDISAITPYNMFPRTSELETLCVLMRK